MQCCACVCNWCCQWKLDSLPHYWSSVQKIYECLPSVGTQGISARFHKLVNYSQTWPIVNLLPKDKEHLTLRNNFRVTKKFLITKIDCNTKVPTPPIKQTRSFQKFCLVLDQCAALCVCVQLMLPVKIGFTPALLEQRAKKLWMNEWMTAVISWGLFESWETKALANSY